MFVLLKPKQKIRTKNQNEQSEPKVRTKSQNYNSEPERKVQNETSERKQQHDTSEPKCQNYISERKVQNERTETQHQNEQNRATTPERNIPTTIRTKLGMTNRTNNHNNKPRQQHIKTKKDRRRAIPNSIPVVRRIMLVVL